MSRRPSRTQSRARARAFALDPRLAVGIILVVASVVGVVSIVAASDESTEVYAAATTLTPGDRVTGSELVIRRVNLSDVGQHYIAPGELPQQGFVATRPIDAGELIPVSSLGSYDSLSLTAIVVSIQGGLPAAVATGASVDVWASAQAEGGRYAAPGVIVSGAVVVRIVDDESLVSSARGSTIELLVPRSRVARLLEAMANADVLSVIPDNLPAGG